MQVCGVLKIKAITRNQDHQEHGFLLEWLDRDNHRHYWSMPAELFKGDGADYRGQLLSCGLYIAPTATARMRLAEYIQNHHTAARALCVDKTGWYQHLFITPSHTYGKQSEHEIVIYQSSQSFINGYRQRGTLDEWRDKVAVLCVGNSRLVLSICVAFAGSLLRLAHEESGGFHLRGNSSVGKSTGQHLACSVWGSRDYKQTWRATINGLEGIAALYNDGLLVLDEMAQADPKAIGETVYMLGNEQGKIRSQKSLIPRKNLSWKLLFLSSGELSLEQMMRDGGKKTKAGQEVRLVDIAADAGKRMGMVESLNGYPSAKELMDTLNRRTSQYYGVAGHTFLGAITQQPDEISQFLKDFKQRFIKANVQQGASEQVLRVASRFALVAAAGEMATDEGITGWPKGEAYKAVVSCFNAWLEGRGGTGNQEVQAIKSQVRAFFEAHGESRFADWDDNPVTPRTVINRAGFRRKHEDGDIYAVLPQVYSNDICAGFDVRTVNKVLIEAGWVEPDKDGKTQQRPYLPSIGRTRAYVFTTRIWQDD
jgi:putative DNA primase/helicase